MRSTSENIVVSWYSGLNFSAERANVAHWKRTLCLVASIVICTVTGWLGALVARAHLHFNDLHCLFTRRNVYYASYRSLGFPIIELFLDKEADVAKHNVNNVQFSDTSNCIC